MTPQLKMNGALAHLLSGFRDRDIVVMLNHGNRGDGLVHLGGRQLLGQLGLTYREIHENDDLSHVRGDLLLIHGAGAIARRTHALPRLMKAVAPRFQHIVLLPSSFDLNEPNVRDFAATWDEKYSVFCRELVSLNALQQAGATPNVLLLGHDLAFHADLKPWVTSPAKGRVGIFRQDREATYGKLPRDLDMYEDASYGSDREPERLLDFIARFQEIHTDRCHAAIAAAMMGRTVVLYRNSFFKNQAIYDHSLAGKPHVHFARRTSFSWGQFARVTYWTRLRPLELKVRRLFRGRPAVAQG